MKSGTFNTGREYSSEGQIINYLVLQDNRVAFNDITRGLDFITVNRIDMDLWDIEEFLMTEYDEGSITATWLEERETRDLITKMTIE